MTINPEKECTIEIKVQPNQKKFGIKKPKEYSNAYRVSVKSPASKGKANAEIVKELSARFNGCQIKKGLLSPNKVVLLLVSHREFNQQFKD